MIKRAFDILLASSALIVLGAPMLLVALLIRWRLGSPVIFRQTRPGLHGTPFTLYKFRTMSDHRDEHGDLLPDGSRLSRLGRMLRSTSVDELPELWNVLKGDMSIVGPRPLLLEYLALYSQEQRRRHDVRPGLTGWAQINGRNAVSWDDRFKLDVWYVENRNFWLDIVIICKTLIQVARRANVFQPGHATMERFKGSSDAKNGVSDS